jgi:hypothetical protein
MRHLTATTIPTTAIRRGLVLRPTVSRLRRSHPFREHRLRRPPPSSLPSAILAPRRHPLRPGSVFCSRIPNFVEMPSASFHYSVNGQDATVSPAARYVCRRPLHDGVPAPNSLRSNFEVAATDPSAELCDPVLAPGGCYPAPTHQEVMNEPSTHSGRSRLRTGGRKNDAPDCDFARGIRIHITVTNVRIMRIDKKILATHFPCPTVAPILHNSERASSANHGTTLNNGAAA